jgi:hypothetical protein
MKTSFILLVFATICLITHGQNNPTKITMARSVKNQRIIPSQKAVVIRKGVVNLKTQLVQLSDSISVSKKEIDVLVNKMENDLNSMNEMSEEESLRLQMAMDRLSKMMNTLSNIMKKISDTQQSITQNMK